MCGRRGSTDRAAFLSALFSSQNRLSSGPDLPSPAPRVGQKGRLLPHAAPFPFLAPGLGFGCANDHWAHTTDIPSRQQIHQISEELKPLSAPPLDLVAPMPCAFASTVAP